MWDCFFSWMCNERGNWITSGLLYFPFPQFGAAFLELLFPLALVPKPASHCYRQPQSTTKAAVMFSSLSLCVFCSFPSSVCFMIIIFIIIFYVLPIAPVGFRLYGSLVSVNPFEALVMFYSDTCVCLSVCLSVCVVLRLSVCPRWSPLVVPVFACLFVWVFQGLSVCLSVLRGLL